ncbi:ribonuclease HII [Rhodanobacter sp. B04]|uniref:ribonuclease HII n=1 Tax=Rhodanobacter sp. B04 TaxID=1945860 RepID=UPI000985B43C|nr:ribonuclease HII [Rhodanobacter sp. B04]
MPAKKTVASAKPSPRASLDGSVAVSARNFFIAGVDEAGRGPLAGPLAVAAVILDPDRPIAGLNDSKKLSEARREALYPLIIERALAYCVILIEPDEIDRLNIFQATMTGMSRAVAGLAPAAHEALIDGNKLPKDLPCPGRAIIGGDALEPAISAASILAKVSRDRLMVAMDAVHPGYGFAVHKGYPTQAHLTALQKLGPCAQHRSSFAPVRLLLDRARLL